MADTATNARTVKLAGPEQTVADGINGGEVVACPDPAAHEKHAGGPRLQDQASKAALYVTSPGKGTEQAKAKPLGADGKLSSAGAATSLKHARAQDLPSFPSTGGLNAAHSHSAANLANTNQKPFEHWRPDASRSAGKAASLAHDNQKPFEHWRPESSNAGSRAALLAHKDGPKNDWWQPEASKDGSSAAHMAMGKKGLAPKVDYGYTEDGHKRALMAATGAINSSNARKRSDSAPNPRANAAVSKSAEKIDSGRWASDAMQAARIQHSNASREMYTERPPVEIERVEAQHQAALRASAVSMAKKMYSIQQHHIDAAAGVAGAAGASAAHSRSNAASTRQESVREAALQHLTLQEAAQRLAEERLAKMKTDDAAAYREYYNYTEEPPRSPRGFRNKLSMRARPRANSDATSEAPTHDRWADSDDEEQSQRIRKQMSIFKSQVQDVDVKKRQSDRAALIAAAEKKVQAQMLNMDEKVFNDTGKMSPAMVEEYENKARLRLQQQREAERLDREQSGGLATAEGDKTGGNARVHIGGNKFMTMAEIEEIARNRINPTLQEIDEQAEKQRAKDESERLDREEKKRLGKVEKEKEHEKKLDEKRVKAEEKAHARQEKEAEKARLKEEKRLSKEDKRRSKNLTLPATTNETAAGGQVAPEVSAAVPTEGEESIDPVSDAPVLAPVAVPSTSLVADETPSVVATEASSTPAPAVSPTHHGLLSAAPAAIDGTAAPEATPETTGELMESIEEKPVVTPTATPAATSVATSTTTPSATPAAASTSAEKGGLRGLLNKFKRKSKANPGEIKGFAGGHRLSKTTLDKEAAAAQAESVPAEAAPVAAVSAGPGAAGQPDEVGRSRVSSVSSVSDAGVVERQASVGSVEDEEDEPRGRQRLNPRTAGTAADGNKLNTTDTNATGTEEFEEARDTFDDALAPPQPVFTTKKPDSVESSSPHRDSKFIEDV